MTITGSSHRSVTSLRRALLRGAALAVAIAASAGAAQAQEAPQAEDAQAQTTIMPLEIIVLGQKLERTVRETASSIDVITAERLNERNDQATVADALRGVPNVIYAGDTDAPIIRGIDAKGPITFGNAYLSKPVPGATISVDGRYLNAGELDIGAAGTWDVASIEVYRGPQTTSQGANAIAGAVVMNTNDPTFSPEFAGQVLLGERNKYRASLAASAPLSGDIAVRVAIDYSGRDTFVTYSSPTFTADDFDFDWMNLNVRTKLLWEPVSIPGLSAKLTYSHTKAERPRNEAVSEPYADLQNATLYQDNLTTNNDTGLFDLSYEFGNGMRLHNQLQYSEGSYDYRFAPPFAGIADRSNTNVSNETRLNFGNAGNGLSGVVGFYYWHDKTRNILDNELGNADADLTHISLAPFAELSLRSGRWVLTGALRYQHDTVKHNGTASYVPGVTYVYSGDFDAVLPKLSLSYDLTDEATVGVLVSRGYTPGGTGLNFRGAQYYTFGKETAWNYELFTRMAFWDGRVTINGNLFYTDYRGSQRSVTDYLDGRPFGAIIVNADKAETFGAEIGFEAQPFSALTIYGSLGLLDTEISEFADYRGEVFVGNEFSRAPGHMFTLGADLKITSDLRISGDVRHTGGYYSDDTNDPALKVGSCTLANLRSSWTLASGVELFGYVTNLFDSHAPVQRFIDRSVAGTSAYIVEPREVGGGVRLRF
tara:strand:- start:1040 stop:3166 length:2127 start_codon:yes stop_codon:yes gene_type:complete